MRLKFDQPHRQPLLGRGPRHEGRAIAKKGVEIGGRFGRVGLEHLLIGARRLAIAAELAHVLQRGRTHVLVGGRLVAQVEKSPEALALYLATLAPDVMWAWPS